MDVNLFTRMLVSLLSKNGKAALNGFGTFSTEVVPAYFSDKGFTINPPYLKVLFTPGGGKDDALTKLYADSNDADPAQAEMMINAQVAQIRKEVLEKKDFVLPGLGRLRATSAGEVFFVPSEDLNLFPAYDSLEPVSLKSLAKAEEASREAHSDSSSHHHHHHHEHSSEQPWEQPKEQPQGQSKEQPKEQPQEQSQEQSKEQPKEQPQEQPKEPLQELSSGEGHDLQEHSSGEGHDHRHEHHQELSSGEGHEHRHEHHQELSSGEGHEHRHEHHHEHSSGEGHGRHEHSSGEHHEHHSNDGHHHHHHHHHSHEHTSTSGKSGKKGGMSALGWIFVILLVLAALLFCGLAVMGRLYPEIVDQWLYTPEQLEILHYKF